MPTPVDFMKQYRALSVKAAIDDPVSGVCREGTHQVQIKTYFMMNWTAGTEQMNDFNAVTGGGKKDNWFQTNSEKIKTAAMGKGAPHDYELALEWAVRSGKIATPNQSTIQKYCDEHLGIDCSGFVTNYLIASGKKPDSDTTRRNTSAASYYNAAKAINDPTSIRQGDLLVWMSGNAVKTDPGHIAVVDSYSAQSKAGGNMRVVEATGASGASPKLLDSMYSVERIIDKGGAVPVMILVVSRHGTSGNRVCVIRP